MFEGKFIPVSQKKNKYYDLQNNNSKFYKELKNKKYNIVCINDSNEALEYEKIKNELVCVFDQMFPEKCKFEK